MLRSSASTCANIDTAINLSMVGIRNMQSDRDRRIAILQLVGNYRSAGRNRTPARGRKREEELASLSAWERPASDKYMKKQGMFAQGVGMPDLSLVMGIYPKMRLRLRLPGQN